ncbi:tRNA (adenosine(37)-N6)-dimethylallyltransferase MiaA [Amphibacillus sp. Q70]|uniref:tRNA (adenosine(37)-N6)-dimethylallyltransferase MiaA n=1 Tax=Amphibacillus sp. Q70 TaxID=3453416 RepID=UPI003F83E854
MKDKVVAVVGPTAVGKTSLGIELATRFNGEIISGDSMQIYRGMDIGTAKVTDDEKGEIPHHMIDIKTADQTFSVAEFQELVQQHIADINKRGKLPIIVGGTGLYIQAALADYHFPEQKRDMAYQMKIEAEIKEHGIEEVYHRLQTIDPVQAKNIHPNNVRRVIRALEIYDRTGQTMTERQASQAEESPYHTMIIGLAMERSLLYERINHRVEIMLEAGLVAEVKFFYDQGLVNAQSMKAIGYKEFIPYFEGEYDFSRAVELLKRNSRRYAKRQYTWFKNKLDVNWYSITPEKKDQVFEKIYTDLAGILKNI